MGTLSEYHEMINGKPRELSDKVRTKDLRWNSGKGQSGMATIFWHEDKPVLLQWYIWDLDHDWMMQQIEKEVGAKIKLIDWQGGNGHMSATIEVIND